MIQVAQLSQRDRAAWWVSRTTEIADKTHNKGYYAVQDHSRSSRSLSIESPYATLLL